MGEDKSQGTGDRRQESGDKSTAWRHRRASMDGKVVRLEEAEGGNYGGRKVFCRSARHDLPPMSVWNYLLDFSRVGACPGGAAYSQEGVSAQGGANQNSTRQGRAGPRRAGYGRAGECRGRASGRRQFGAS